MSSAGAFQSTRTVLELKAFAFTSLGSPGTENYKWKPHHHVTRAVSYNIVENVCSFFHFLKPCKSSSMILFSVFVEVRSSILILTVLQEVSIDYNFKDIPNLCLQKRWSKRCWKIRKWNWTRKDRRVSRGVSSATLSSGGLSLLMQQYFLILVILLKTWKVTSFDSFQEDWSLIVSPRYVIFNVKTCGYFPPHTLVYHKSYFCL